MARCKTIGSMLPVARNEHRCIIWQIEASRGVTPRSQRSTAANVERAGVRRYGTCSPGLLANARTGGGQPGPLPDPFRVFGVGYKATPDATDCRMSDCRAEHGPRSRLLAINARGRWNTTGKGTRISETARRHAVWVKHWHTVLWGVSDTRSGVENEVIFCCRGPKWRAECRPLTREVCPSAMNDHDCCQSSPR